MYTLEEIKDKGTQYGTNGIEINWDKLDIPGEREYLEKYMLKGVSVIPTLEGLYQKLTSGKSVLAPDEDTPLSFEDVEFYSMQVAEALYQAYALQAVKDKYEKVTSILQLAGN